MKKKLLIILGILLFSFNFSLAEDLAQLILFYGKTCPHCKAEEGYLDTLKETYDFEVVGYEVYFNKDNQQKMKEYGEQFGTKFNGVPVVIMGDDYFLGASYDKTVALLDKYATKKDDSECLPEEDKQNQNTNQIVECTGDEENQNTSPIVSLNTGTENSEITTGDTESETGNILDEQTTTFFGKKISLEDAGPILFGSILGFVDGINPCMFGVLILLLSYLMAVGSKKKMLYSGLIFVITTFILYFGIMYGMHGLLSTDFFIKYVSPISLIIGIILVILGLIEIKDFFRYGKGVSLAIPKGAKPILEYITKKGTYMSAFILAVASTFVELPCTIGIPLGYVKAVGGEMNIFTALGVYNFFFVLPLIFIVVGFYFGMSAFKLTESGKKMMRLIAGIILITLGILFLARLSIYYFFLILPFIIIILGIYYCSNAIKSKNWKLLTCQLLGGIILITLCIILIIKTGILKTLLPEIQKIYEDILYVTVSKIYQII